MIRVKRSTKQEARFHPNMGALTTPVTKISKTFMGIPFKTIHEYRETYHGKIKDCNDCQIEKI